MRGLRPFRRPEAHPDRGDDREGAEGEDPNVYGGEDGGHDLLRGRGERGKRGLVAPGQPWQEPHFRVVLHFDEFADDAVVGAV